MTIFSIYRGGCEPWRVDSSERLTHDGYVPLKPKEVARARPLTILRLQGQYGFDGGVYYAPAWYMAASDYFRSDGRPNRRFQAYINSVKKNHEQCLLLVRWYLLKYPSAHGGFIAWLQGNEHRGKEESV